MADGEYGRECCTIRLSDLKLSSQGRALSHPRPWIPGGPGSWHEPTLDGRGRGTGVGGAVRRRLQSRAKSLRPGGVLCRSLCPGPWTPEAHEQPAGTAKTYVTATTRMQRSLWNARPVPALSRMQVQVHLGEGARPGPENVGREPRNSSYSPSSTRPQAVTSPFAPSLLKPRPCLSTQFGATRPNYPWGVGPWAGYRD